MLNRLFRWLFHKRQWFYIYGNKASLKLSPFEYYATVPELNAVVNIRCRAFSNGKVVSERPGLLDAVLKTPNWYQSINEFMLQSHLQRLLYGNEFVYFLSPVGMSKPVAMYVLPSEFVKVKEDKSVPYFLKIEPVVAYEYVSGSVSVPLQRELVAHFSTERLAGSFVGVSPIETLCPVLNNIIYAYESRGTIIKHRGALGILYNNAKDGIGAPLQLDEDEKKDIQKQYQNNYGLLEGQNQLIISNQPLGYIQLSTSPDRLGLYEETKEALFKIADKYGVPIDLLARQQGSTYENQRQAERGFYLRTVIPEASEWIAGLNTMFDTNYSISFSHLYIFNDDIVAKNEVFYRRVEILSKLLQDGIIDLPEYREEVEKFLKI